MLGFQPVEPVRTDSWNEMNAYVHLIARVRVLRDVRRGRDGLYPEREPRGNTPALARFRHTAFVP
jgi:hypothetical protein